MQAAEVCGVFDFKASALWATASVHYSHGLTVLLLPVNLHVCCFPALSVLPAGC
jgi:hypothetical protein